MIARMFLFHGSDRALPVFPLRALEVLAAIGTLSSVAYFFVGYSSGDFAPLCCIAVPLGLAFLVADILSYLGVRRVFPDGPLTRAGANLAARIVIVTNALPILGAIVALLLGVTLGRENISWLMGLPPVALVLGSMAIALVFHPFNVVGLVLGSVGLVLIRRRGA